MKILILVLPYFIGRTFLMPSLSRVGSGAAARIILDILPGIFAATISRMRPIDRRPFKYFLPYCVMARHLADRYFLAVTGGSLVQCLDPKSAHDKTLADASAHTPLARAFRAVMPFGTVLWWDSLAANPSGIVPRTSATPATPAPLPVAMNAKLERILSRLDELEIQLLKLRIELNSRTGSTEAPPAADTSLEGIEK